MREAFRVAVAAASAAVLSPGTELCREADVHRLLPEVMITENRARTGLIALIAPFRRYSGGPAFTLTGMRISSRTISITPIQMMSGK